MRSLGVWYARDYSDGELKEGLFCMEFESVETAVPICSGMRRVGEIPTKGRKRRLG